MDVPAAIDPSREKVGVRPLLLIGTVGHVTPTVDASMRWQEKHV
jgi:hypothetical protein